MLTGREGYFRCVKCGEEKPEADFDLSSDSPTGRKPRCKACRAEDWQEGKTPELIARMNAYSREYAKAHPEKSRERQRRWQVAHPEYGIHYRTANRERLTAANRAWAQANPARRNQREQRRRARKMGASIGEVTPELLQTKWDYWGGLCWMCGEEAREWDHVKPLSKGGAHALVNLRPSCKSCNRRKSAKWPFVAEKERGVEVI